MSLDAYNALSPDDPPERVKSVLDAIANAPSFTFTEQQRQTLVQSLLNDVRTPDNRIGPSNVATALNTVKMLGRQPSIATAIATQENFELLAATINSTDTLVAYNAMKVAANTLLLVLSAAIDKWLATDGPVAAINILKARDDLEPVFLASRLLFLSSVKPTKFVQDAVEVHNLPEILAQRILPTLQAHIAGKLWGKDAIVDVLKVSFNLLLNYPRLVDAEEDADAPTKAMGEGWNSKLDPLVAPTIQAFQTLNPAKSPSPPFGPPLTHIVHSLINLPVEPYTTLWFPESSDTDIAKKAYDLLDVTLAWYFPDAIDPDESSVRERATREDVTIDTLVSPLVALLTRLAAHEPAKVRIREWILPADLDRTKSLEERADLLGRCLRLLKSVYFQRVKDTVGEFLFTICDSDATALAAQVGYGNVAGYLFNKGLVAPPPTSGSGSPIPDGEINPITGMRVDPDAPKAGEDMTEEEKEKEAERLFVLFDRLEKTGMGVQNPFRKAFEEGKIQYP